MRRADLTLAGFSLLFASSMLLAPYLPLVDLPQHASQIATWLRLSDPRLPDAALYDLNFGTPYLVAYGIARLAAPLLGVIGALKLVVTLGVLGTAWAIRELARATGHSPWLGLLALPTAVGYSYYFGFVSFTLATPLALACWRLALLHSEHRSWRSGLALGLLLLVTFACHALGFALALAGCAPLLVERGSWRARALALVPLGPGLALAASWLPGLVRLGAGGGGELWRLGFERFRYVPGLLAGMSAADMPAVLTGTLVLGSCALVLGKPRGLLASVPLLAVVLGYLLLPLQLRSIGFVYPRLVVFLVPALLVAFRPRSSARVRALVAPLALGAAGLWGAVFGARLYDFQRECADFDAVLRDMPEGLAVRPIVFERESRAFPGVSAFLHFSAYYQVLKGGTQGYSFARNVTSVVRERPPGSPAMQNGAEWLPSTFDARRELPLFDCFLVRSASDRAPQLFAGADGAVQLVSRHGQWWAYAKRGPALAAR
ncbi:MAG TPA: hypothetical protein VIW29_06445 [Polyangiaceae bacterium]